MLRIMLRSHRLTNDRPIEEVMRNLVTLRDEGLFTHIGLSEASATTLKRAVAVAPVAAIEIELSLWSMEPAIMDVVNTCTELSIPLIAYSPLGRGMLTGKWKSLDDIHKDDRRRFWPRFQPGNFEKNLEMVKELEKLAEKKGVTSAELALAFLIRLSPMVSNPHPHPNPCHKRNQADSEIGRSNPRLVVLRARPLQHRLGQHPAYRRGRQGY
jgi:pyridoxine 4-dehydrogenase